MRKTSEMLATARERRTVRQMLRRGGQTTGGEGQLVRVSGPEVAVLQNSVSQLMVQACEAGMDVRVAAQLVASVAADYVRVAHGPEELVRLASVVASRGDAPMPKVRHGE